MSVVSAASTKNMASVPRPGSSLVAFWALAGIGALFLGDILIRGAWDTLAVSIAPGGLVIWIAFMVLYRPRVLFDANHVVITNPGRITDVPWRRVTEVRERLQLVVDLETGRSISCWGTPFPDKPGRTRPNQYVPRVSGGVAGPLISACAAAHSTKSEPANGPVVRHWDVVPLVVGGALIVACAIEWAIVR